MVYIALIIGLFAFIYLASLSHWAVIAFLVGIALCIGIWLVRNKKRKVVYQSDNYVGGKSKYSNDLIKFTGETDAIGLYDPEDDQIHLSSDSLENEHHQAASSLEEAKSLYRDYEKIVWGQRNHDDKND